MDLLSVPISYGSTIYSADIHSTTSTSSFQLMVDDIQSPTSPTCHCLHGCSVHKTFPHFAGMVGDAGIIAATLLTDKEPSAKLLTSLYAGVNLVGQAFSLKGVCSQLGEAEKLKLQAETLGVNTKVSFSEFSQSDKNKFYQDCFLSAGQIGVTIATAAYTGGGIMGGTSTVMATFGSAGTAHKSYVEGQLNVLKKKLKEAGEGENGVPPLTESLYAMESGQTGAQGRSGTPLRQPPTPPTRLDQSVNSFKEQSGQATLQLNLDQPDIVIDINIGTTTDPAGQPSQSVNSFMEQSDQAKLQMIPQSDIVININHGTTSSQSAQSASSQSAQSAGLLNPPESHPEPYSFVPISEE